MGEKKLFHPTPPSSPAAGVYVSLEKVVLLKQSNRMFLLLWAGLGCLLQHTWMAVLTAPLAHGPRRESRSAAGCGGFQARPSWFQPGTEEKMPLLNSAPGLMKIRDLLLLTSVHAGFAPEVCSLTVLFPGGLASRAEFGGFLPKHHEFVSYLTCSC